MPADPLGPTHTEFQQQVVDLATIHGWRHLHVRRSIGKGRKWTTATNIKGWPDLQIMRPPAGLIFAELKIPPDRPTPEQEEVLAFLAEFAFAQVFVWTPDDWPEIGAALASGWRERVTRACANCSEPIAAHRCAHHLIPCCPGRCPLEPRPV